MLSRPRMIQKKKTFFANVVVTQQLKQSVSKFYWSPKIHKGGKSMRPIVSAAGSSTYNPANSLIKLFRNLLKVQNSFCVKNSLKVFGGLKIFFYKIVKFLSVSYFLVHQFHSLWNILGIAKQLGPR